MVERIVAASPGSTSDAKMAEVARGNGLEVEVSLFEAWDPAGRTFDAVVSGEAGKY